MVVSHAMVEAFVAEETMEAGLGAFLSVMASDPVVRESMARELLRAEHGHSVSFEDLNEEERELQLQDADAALARVLSVLAGEGGWDG